MKQKRHPRRYKSGIVRIINPKNFSMYPLGRKKDLRIVWDKKRLQDFYEDEDLIKKTGMNFDKSDSFAAPEERLRNIRSKSERVYNRYAKGIRLKDRDNTIQKVPYKRLSRDAQLEIKLIEGGFIDPKTGKISKKYRGKDDED
jgi:hypothetical protein